MEQRWGACFGMSFFEVDDGAAMLRIRWGPGCPAGLFAPLVHNEQGVNMDDDFADVK